MSAPTSSAFVPIAAMMFAAGLGIPVFAALNAALGQQLGGPVAATAVTFAVGFVIASAMLAFTGFPAASAFTFERPWLWIGALVMLFYATSVAFSAPRIGLGNHRSFRPARLHPECDYPQACAGPDSHGSRPLPSQETRMTNIRTDWSRDEIAALFDLPFTELLFQAATVHREFHPPEQVQLCTLLSIKTGGCPEDCGYCSQSVKADSGVEATKLMEVQSVLQRAAQAKDQGSQRFCMGAAWRNPKDRDMPAIVEIVKGVRAMGLETCMTLGMLTPKQADMLKDAGLDYYNHNVDTGPEYYERVISTRNYQDRLDTLQNVRDAGINVCSGGIVGMGETRDDRVGFVHTLATLERHPESVPVNALVPVKGTVLGDMLADTPLAKIDDIEFVRTVAVARICMPMSMVRLSAGRESMSEATQALCFMAGANSIFTGDKLLTAPNAGDDTDAALFAKLGLTALQQEEPMRAASCQGACEPAE